MAERMSTAVLIFLLLLNGSATMMTASGLAGDIGVNPNPGLNDEMDSIVTDSKDAFNPNSGVGDTLFAMFGAAFSAFKLLIQGVFSAPTMFVNLGFPSWFVIPVFAPMYFVVTLDLIYVATGRSA